MGLLVGRFEGHMVDISSALREIDRNIWPEADEVWTLSFTLQGKILVSRSVTPSRAFLGQRAAVRGMEDSGCFLEAIKSPLSARQIFMSAPCKAPYGEHKMAAFKRTCLEIRTASTLAALFTCTFRRSDDTEEAHQVTTGTDVSLNAAHNNPNICSSDEVGTWGDTEWRIPCANFLRGKSRHYTQSEECTRDLNILLLLCPQTIT